MFNVVNGKTWILAALLSLFYAGGALLAQTPTEPTVLHVDSTDSQAGTQGNPVTGVDFSPVFSAVFNHQDGGATTTQVRIQVATDAAFTSFKWSAGYQSIASTTAGARCPDVPYAGQALSGLTTYFWRIRFKDSLGNESPWSTEAASFTTIAEPLEPNGLFVDSSDAQAGTQGNPVDCTDLSPVFSALFNHQNANATTTEVRIQVADDPGFTSFKWSAGYQSIAGTTAGARCPDVPYTGQALSGQTTYYWRVRFKDSLGNESPWSTEAASFTALAGSIIDSDIATDEVWDTAGSPYFVCPKTGSISIRNNATVTIDASQGPVVVEWQTDCDFILGDSADNGTLIVDNTVDNVDFRIHSGGNIIVTSTGRFDILTRNNRVAFYPSQQAPDDNWGSLVFNAGQTRTSTLQAADFEYAGYDGHQSAVVVQDSAVHYPGLADLTFDSCLSSALHLAGRGANTLANGNIDSPVLIANTPYSVVLSNAISTTDLRFPVLATASTGSVLVQGNCQVGEGSSSSEWRFGIPYVFDCDAGVQIRIENGSIHGASNTIPVFRSSSATPTNSDWIGLVDNSQTTSNASGGFGPFRLLEVRDAIVGVDLDKGSLVPQSGQITPAKLEGIKILHCERGIRVQTKIDTSASLAGFRIEILNCTIGGSTTGTRCETACIDIHHGRVLVENSRILGASADCIRIGSQGVAPNIVTIRSSRVQGSGAVTCVNADTTAGFGELRIETSILTDADTALRLHQDAAFTPSRSVVVQDSAFSGSANGIEIDVPASSSFDVTIERSTILNCGQRGVWCYELPATGTFNANACRISSCTLHGVEVRDAATNTASYGFTNCQLTANGDGAADHGGLRDARTNTGVTTLSNCSIFDNNPFGVVDDDATTQTNAANCYWGAADGPSGNGPGTGDAVTSNVVINPFLSVPPQGIQLGGTPIVAAGLRIYEDPTTEADPTHVLTQLPTYSWTMMSDFIGTIQVAYQIQTATDALFTPTSIIWDSGEVFSGASTAAHASSAPLQDGLTYYGRVRLSEGTGARGPWTILEFHTNQAPGKPSNIGRSPADQAFVNDATPVLQWPASTDPEDDLLIYTVMVDDDPTFANTNGEQRIVESRQAQINGGFEYTTNGLSWSPLPLEGLRPSQGAILVRLVLPDVYLSGHVALDNRAWYWRILVVDNLEDGPPSDEWQFSVNVSITIAGRYADSIGQPLPGRTISLYHGGSVIGVATTQAPAGNFSLTLSTNIPIGDPLVFFDSSATAAGYATHFTGNDFTDGCGPTGTQFCSPIEAYFAAPKDRYVELIQGALVFDQRLSQPLDNGNIASFSDPLFPWFTNLNGENEVHSGIGQIFLNGTMTLAGFLPADTLTLHPSCEIVTFSTSHWTTTSFNKLVVPNTRSHIGSSGDLVGSFTCTNGGQFEFLSTVTVKGFVRLLGVGTIFFRGGFDLEGTIEARSGAIVADLPSTVKGVLDGEDLTIELGSGNTLTIDGGNIRLDKSRMLVGGRLVNQSGRLYVTETEFSFVHISIESQGILERFDDNRFGGGLAVGANSHIRWEATLPDNVDTISNNLFFVALNPGAEFNISASAAANVQSLVVTDSEGAGSLPSYEDDPGSKIDWTMISPSQLNAQAGDTRTRLTWLPVKLPSGGSKDLTYNIYRGTTPTGIGTTPANVTPISATEYVDEGLTNGQNYYYQVRVAGNSAGDVINSGPSETASAKPLPPTITSTIPATVLTEGNTYLTLIGHGTHWDTATPGSATTIVLNHTGGGTVTLANVTVLSPSLLLAELSSTAASGSLTIDVTTTPIWGLPSYTEVVSTQVLQIEAEIDCTLRPTIAFVDKPGQPDVTDGSTFSGPFYVALAYDDQGGPAIDTSTLEVVAWRPIKHLNVLQLEGTNLAGLGSGTQDAMFDVMPASAEAFVEQTSADQQFLGGCYFLYARIANSVGLYSDWVEVEFCVDDGFYCDDYNFARQGTCERTSFVCPTAMTPASIDAGAGVEIKDIEVLSSTTLGATVTVDDKAQAGPREVIWKDAAGNEITRSIMMIEYPTDLFLSRDDSITQEPARNPAMGAQGVILRNGVFTLGESDHSTRGRALGIDWRRQFRSDLNFNGPLGRGWTGYYFQRVRQVGSGSTAKLLWYTPEGRIEEFTYNTSTGTYDAPAGVYTLVEEDATYNTFALHFRHGFSCYFNTQGRLAKCIDRNGNCVECDYNFRGQLVTITDDRGAGYEYEIIYAPHGRVDRIRDHIWNLGSASKPPREVEYTYTDAGFLGLVQYPETDRYGLTGARPRIAKSYRYGSDTNRRVYPHVCPINHPGYHQARLTDVIAPNEHDVTATFEPQIHIEYTSKRVVLQKSHLATYYVRYPSFQSNDFKVRIMFARGNASVLDHGTITDYVLGSSQNDTGRATQVIEQTGFFKLTNSSVNGQYDFTVARLKLRASDPDEFVTAYEFNADGEVTKVTLPKLNSVEYEYQQTGGVLAAPNVMRETFSPAPGATPTYAYSDIVKQFTYEPQYQFVATYTEPRGASGTPGQDFVTEYFYDEEGNLTRTEYPQVTFARAHGGATSHTIETRNTYNEHGQLITTTDGEGHVYLYEYHPVTGYLMKTTSGLGELDIVESWDYDPVGNVIKYLQPRAFSVSPSGNDDYAQEMTYNELDELVTSTQPGYFSGTAYSRTSDHYFYDANGNVTDILMELIDTSGIRPPAPSDPLDPDSFDLNVANGSAWFRTRYTYNIVDQLVSKTYPQFVDEPAGASGSSSSSATFSEKIEYENGNLPCKSTKGQGNVTIIQYDERQLPFFFGYATSETEGVVEGRDYDLNGNMVVEYDAVAFQPEALNDVPAFVQTRSVRYHYDGFDRIVAVADQAGHFSTSRYDEASYVTESATYDAAAGLTNWLGGSPAKEPLELSSYTIDEVGRTRSVSVRARKADLSTAIGDGEDLTDFIFDKNSNVVATYDDNDFYATVQFDAVNRPVRTIDPLGNETTTSYEANGLVRETAYREIVGSGPSIDVGSDVVEYDAGDRVIASRDRRFVAGSHDTEVSYENDSWGRVRKVIDPFSTSSEIVYDLLSRQVLEITKPDENDATTWTVVSNEYDQNHRLAAKRRLQNPANETQARDPSAWATGVDKTSYGYDGRNRLVSVLQPNGSEFGFNYNEFSELSRLTLPSGHEVTQTFDVRHLLHTRTISPNPPFNPAPLEGAFREEYKFDALGRLESSENFGKNPGGEPNRKISKVTWEYNTLSLPEEQTAEVFDRAGKQLRISYKQGFELPEPLDSWTMKAEYDETGFMTATEYWDGRRYEHTFDPLYRLEQTIGLGTVSDDPNKPVVAPEGTIASYQYSGAARLQSRTFGNGTMTEYEYEKPAGVGGPVSLELAKVSHKRGNTTLFEVERRYDLAGNVTAERRGHLGGKGRVYRYDDKYRLIETYTGVDLADNADFDAYADPMTSVGTSVFGFKRSYKLDPSGSRTAGGSDPMGSGFFVGTVDETRGDATDGLRGLYNKQSAPVDNMNLYDVAEGFSQNHDSTGRRTYDDATGLSYFYDYKGALVEVRLGEKPVEYYGYDCLGRRVFEETAPEDRAVFTPQEDSGPRQTVIVQHVGMGGPAMGACEAGELVTGKELADGSFQADSVIYYVNGIGAGEPGSVATLHPLVPAAPPSVQDQFNCRVYEFILYCPDNPELVKRWRHEDQLGSLIGTTGSIGQRFDEIDYTDYGRPIWRPVLTESSPNAPILHDAFTGETFVPVFSTVAPSGEPTNEVRAPAGQGLIKGRLAGCEVRLSVPGNLGDKYISARTGAGIGARGLAIQDPGSRIFDALMAFPDASLVVLDRQNGHINGYWDEVREDFIGTFPVTVFRDSDGTFPSYFKDSSGVFRRFVQPMAGGAMLEIEGLFPGRDDEIYLAGHGLGFPLSGPGFMPYAYQMEQLDRPMGLSGEWQTISSSGGMTTFTVPAHKWNPDIAGDLYDEVWDFQAGWLLQPDSEEQVFLEIVTADEGARTLTVRGTLFGFGKLIESGTARFTVYPSPGTDKRWQRNGARSPIPTCATSRCLYAGYRYDPPQTGTYWIDISTSMEQMILGTVQPGANHAGLYYCFNNEYDPRVGRWLAPDPMWQTWFTGTDYAGCDPIKRRDPCGLESEYARARRARVEGAKEEWRWLEEAMYIFDRVAHPRLYEDYPGQSYEANVREIRRKSEALGAETTGERLASLPLVLFAHWYENDMDRRYMIQTGRTRDGQEISELDRHVLVAEQFVDYAVIALSIAPAVFAPPTSFSLMELASTGLRTLRSLPSRTLGWFIKRRFRTLRPPAITPGPGEAVPVSGGSVHSRMPFEGQFSEVTPGQKYLFTIDERGLNIALESTSANTKRGFITHTNISQMAAAGGEAVFSENGTVTINFKSARFGAAARKNEKWVLRYWRSLGYKVEYTRYKGK